jgi:hypothetical protein
MLTRVTLYTQTTHTLYTKVVQTCLDKVKVAVTVQVGLVWRGAAPAPPLTPARLNGYCAKAGNLSRCWRRICRSSGKTPGFTMHRVPRIPLHEVCSGYTNWTFAQVEARCAGGGVVHGDRFSQNICTVCKCFVKNDGFFRPAGGGISCRVNDRVPPVTLALPDPEYREHRTKNHRTNRLWCSVIEQLVCSVSYVCLFSLYIQRPLPVHIVLLQP